MTITLHEFILKTFNETELLILCDSDGELKNVKAEFSNSMSLGEKIRRLIYFCERRGLSEVLRRKIKEERRNQWGAYQMPEDKPASDVEKMRENRKEVESTFKELKAIDGMDIQMETSKASGNTTKSLKIFICHATEDKINALKVYEYLKNNGFQPWLDSIDLIPGQKWEVEIPKVIESSDIILVCLSQYSVTKEGYVQKEINIALDKALEIPDEHIFLIPVRFDNSKTPRSLNQYQWVDLFEKYGYSKLLKSLHLRAKQLNRFLYPQ